MRITLITFVGILSYLLIILPGYLLFVSEDEKVSEITETLNEIPVSSSTAKTTVKMTITNPGEAPLLK